MTTTKALLFDLDGTLIDTAQNFQAIINALREKNHLPPLDIAPVRLATSQGASALAALGWDATLNDPHFTQYRQEFLRAYKQYIMENPVVFFPGIEEILELIQKDIPWGIVTNKHAQFTRAIVARHPILATAKTIVSGDTLEHNKPHPAPLLYACNELLISPQYCLFIGDHQKDIQAGLRAGTDTGVALYGYLSPLDKPETWGANYTFANPAEIKEWIEKWMGTA
jgi:2-phosphoglycolate phosphatase